MITRSIAIAGLVAGGALFALGDARATPNVAGAQLSPPAAASAPLAEPAQWRPGYGNYCRRVRFRCADRWGWGTWRFRRCVTFRGCGRFY